jgi:hypothetical protein
MPLTNTLGWNSQQLLQDMLADPNLVFAMPLNEVSNTVYDRCLAGQLTGSYTPTFGAAAQYGRPIKSYSTGRLLNGSTQYFNQASNAATNRMGNFSFTFAVWFRPAAAFAGTNQGIFAKDGNTATTKEYRLYFNDADWTVTFGVSKTGTAYTEVTSSTLLDELQLYGLQAWHLAVCWYDLTTTTIYIQIDNQTISSQSGMTPVYSAGAAAFEIGRQQLTYFNGTIGPMGIWKRTLTAAERTALFRGNSWAWSYSQLQQAQSTLTTGLAEWWDMTDSSGNATASVGTNLTAFNTPTTGGGVIIPDPYDLVGIDFANELTPLDISNSASGLMNFDWFTPFSAYTEVTPLSFGIGYGTRILRKLDAPSIGWYWGYDTSGYPTLFLGNATYSISKTSTTLLAAGTTYNLGFSYDGGGTPAGITLYRNGVAETGTGTTGTSLNALTIRNNQNVQIGEYAIADIGLTAVFNSAKTVIDFRRWATEGGFR